MSPKLEAVIGSLLWFAGTAVILGVALATPRFFSEGMVIGAAIVILGFYLIWCGMIDWLADDFNEEIKESYNDDDTRGYHK